MRDVITISIGGNVFRGLYRVASIPRPALTAEFGIVRDLKYLNFVVTGNK
jgi:hypothetical protein